MEKPNSLHDREVAQNDLESLRELGDSELAEIKNSALEEYNVLERLILAISRIEDERGGQEVLF